MNQKQVSGWILSASLVITSVCLPSCSDESIGEANARIAEDVKLISADYLKTHLWRGLYEMPEDQDSIHREFGIRFTDDAAYLIDYYGTREGTWSLENIQEGDPITGEGNQHLLRLSFPLDSEGQIGTAAFLLTQHPRPFRFSSVQNSMTGFRSFRFGNPEKPPHASLENNTYENIYDHDVPQLKFSFGSETDHTITVTTPTETLTGTYYYDSETRNVVRVNLENGGKFIIWTRSIDDIFGWHWHGNLDGSGVYSNAGNAVKVGP